MEQTLPQVLDGLDTKLHVAQDGLTFERPKSRSLGRGVAPTHHVPWSAVVGADLHPKALRILVAGYTPPRTYTADPHAVGLRRGQAIEAERVLETIQSRAAATSAVPMGPSPEPGATENAPTSRTVTTEERKLDRLMDLSIWALNFQLIVIVGGVILTVVAFAVVLVALL